MGVVCFFYAEAEGLLLVCHSNNPGRIVSEVVGQLYQQENHLFSSL